jgi:hypothetical protein
VKIEAWNGRQVSVPGAYRMGPATYHGDPCETPSLSNSVAKILLAETPLHAWTAHPRLNPNAVREQGTRRTALGEAVHRMVLGRGADLAPIPAANYRTKAAQAMRDEAVAAGKIPILADSEDETELSPLAQAEAITEAARAQLPAHGLGALARGEGDAEVAVFAQDGDLWLRALLDWWSSDGLTIVDLKTVESASPAAFARNVAQMGYDLQDSHYLRTVGRAFPELAGRARYLFAAVEITPPYALQVFEVSQPDRFVADRRVEQAAADFARCLRANEWPGYAPGIHSLTLPPWHNRDFLEQELTRNETGEASAQWQFAIKGETP